MTQATRAKIERGSRVQKPRNVLNHRQLQLRSFITQLDYHQEQVCPKFWEQAGGRGGNPPESPQACPESGTHPPGTLTVILPKDITFTTYHTWLRFC